MTLLDRSVRYLIALMVVGFIGAFAASGESDHISVTDRFCTLAGNAGLSPEAVPEKAGTLDCSDERFSKSTNYLWLAGSVAEISDIRDQNYLILRPSRQYDIRVFITYTDGHSEDETYTSSEQASHWHPLDTIALPINTDGRAIKDIVIGIETPWDPANWGDIALARHKTSFDGHVYELVLVGLFCGLLFAPIFLNIVFSLVIENRFVIFHGIMMVGIIIYALSWSGLLFGLIPDMTLWQRSTLNHLIIPVCILAASLLTRELCEPGMLSPAMRRGLVIAGGAPVLIGWPLVLLSPALPHYGSMLYHAAFILPLLMLPTALIVARLRGSHMALIQIIGWSGLIALIAARILIGLSIIPDSELTTLSFFPVLIFEAIITTLTVSYRIIRLRHERDKALAKQAETLQVAETDYLTNIPNRRAFVEHFSSLLDRKHKRRQASALLLLDLDHFKTLNDTYGHDIGDEVLIQFANLLDQERRYEDVCARIGGEEFAVLVHAQTQEDTVLCAERLCRVIASTVFTASEHELPQVTVSIGIAAINMQSGGTFNDYYAQADAALYTAKQNGRNQVVRADPSITAKRRPPGAPAPSVDDAIRSFAEDQENTSDQVAAS